jgi:hypothetical protein
LLLLLAVLRLHLDRDELLQTSGGYRRSAHGKGPARVSAAETV